LGLNTRALGVRITIHAGEPGAGIPATRARIPEQPQLRERVIAAVKTGVHLRPIIEFAPTGLLPRTEMKSRRFRVSHSA
jgi:hypothetical protein